MRLFQLGNAGHFTAFNELSLPALLPLSSYSISELSPFDFRDFTRLNSDWVIVVMLVLLLIGISCAVKCSAGTGTVCYQPK